MTIRSRNTLNKEGNSTPPSITVHGIFRTVERPASLPLPLFFFFFFCPPSYLYIGAGSLVSVAGRICIFVSVLPTS